MGGRRGDSVGDNTGYDGSEDKDEGGERGRRMNGSPRVEFLQLRVHAFEFCNNFETILEESFFRLSWAWKGWG